MSLFCLRNCDKASGQEPGSGEEKVGPDHPGRSKLVESWDVLGKVLKDFREESNIQGYCVLWDSVNS